MKHKTESLDGALLDAAVAKVEGWSILRATADGYACERSGGVPQMVHRWSRDWGAGGRLIDRKKPAFRPGRDDEIVCDIMNERGTFVGIGPTYLIAFCRALVASELGDKVELP